MCLANMGVFWGGYIFGTVSCHLMKAMITEGYAWAYDGGTKQKNLKTYEIRRSFGTLNE